MLTPGIEKDMYYKARHQELPSQAQQYRLVKEVRKGKPAKASRFKKILFTFDKRLVSLGSGLEERYSSTPHIEVF